jgi:Flp pilus assembly secretin CpaC
MKTVYTLLAVLIGISGGCKSATQTSVPLDVSNFTGSSEMSFLTSPPLPEAPKVIQIQFQVVEVASSDIPMLTEIDGFSLKMLARLQKQEKTSVTHTLAISTHAGQQATVKGVIEYVYPTAFETRGIDHGPYKGGDTVGGVEQKFEGTLSGALPIPTDFQTREVGAILEVLPEILPSGDIHVLLSPEVVYEPEIRSMKDFSELGRERHQPFFKTLQLRSNVTLKDGGRKIIAVSPKPDDKSTTLITIIGVNILN